MREKIANSIALHQMSINELKEIKRAVTDGVNDTTKFVVETVHLVPYDIGLFKRKNKLDVSVYTMNLILDEVIKKERERIDKLIDMEIERKLKK